MRKTIWLFLALIFLTAQACWAAYGSIYVTSSPSGAEVYFDGSFLGTTPLLSDSVPTGSHSLRLHLNGYSDGYAGITVKADLTSAASVSLSKIAPKPAYTPRPKPVYTPRPTPAYTPKPTPVHTSKPTQTHTPKPTPTFTPEPTPSETPSETLTPEVTQKSYLTLTTVPDGAEVTVDDNPLGNAPLTEVELDPGQRTLVVTSPGYLTLKKQITLTAGKTTELTLTLKPGKQSGELDLSTVPSEVQVLLDGKKLKDTPPFVTKLPPGKHKLRIEKDGYKPLEQVITITPGQTLRLQLALEMMANGFGDIYVDSNPQGATILLNEKDFGVTPKLLEKVPAGAYDLRLELKDYYSAKKPVKVEKDKSVNLEVFTLKPTFGTLLLSSAPPGASVFLNDQLQEVHKTPVSLELPPGEYTVRLQMDGFQEIKQTVTLKEGEETKLALEMTRIGPDYSTWAFIGLIVLAVIMLLAGLIRGKKPKAAPIPAETSLGKVRPLGSETVLSLGRGGEFFPGSTLGNFVIGGKIANGSTGVIYEAQNKGQKNVLALKVVYESLVEVRNFGKTFLKKAQQAKGLVHPGIARVMDMGEFNGAPFVTMEKVNGEDLRKILRRESPLELKNVFLIVGGVLEALDFGHGKKIIHGHVKPENIMITPDGKIKMLDFGLGHAISLLDLKGSYAGKPTYISPEHLTDSQDPRSDLYSLGVVLYEMVTGTPPFTVEHPLKLLEAHRKSVPPAPRTLNPNLPYQVEELILKLLAKNPDDRFSSAKAVSQVVTALMAGLG